MNNTLKHLDGDKENNLTKTKSWSKSVNSTACFTGLQLYFIKMIPVFSCEYCKIFKNSFFIEHFRWLLLYVVFFFFAINSFAKSSLYKAIPATLKVWNMFKVNNETPERHHWRRSGVFVVNSEYISHHFLVFLLLTLNN